MNTSLTMVLGLWIVQHPGAGIRLPKVLYCTIPVAEGSAGLLEDKS